MLVMKHFSISSFLTENRRTNAGPNDVTGSGQEKGVYLAFYLDEARLRAGRHRDSLREK